MPFATACDPFRVGTPWGRSRDELIDALQRLIRFDRLYAAVGCGARIAADEFLLVEGWASQDDLGRLQTRAGARPDASVSVEAADTDPRGRFVLSAILREAGEGSTCWMLGLTRAEEPFSDVDVRTAELVLRRWQYEFLQPGEPRLSQLLLGHDDRLLASDLTIQACCLREPEVVDDLIRAFRTLVAQRYPDIEEQKPFTGDVALPIGDVPTWVRFSRRRAADLPGAAHWHLELRPLQFKELAAVGLLNDTRLAQAVAFLDEAYRRSPSLAETARVAHMSPFHFHRVFRRETGISPKQYLLLKQLEVAAWLLRTRRLPVHSVAEEAGFSSHGHFTTTFRRFFGTSPTEYRDAV